MKIYINISMFMLVIQVSWIPPGMGKFHQEYQIIEQPLSNNSYFGFSATYQPDIKRLIISAPKANNIGKIFSCDINKNTCSEIPINISRVSDQYTHNYMLGATVKAGPDYFLTCAPLTISFLNNTLFGAISTCFKVANNKHVILPSLSEEDRRKYTNLTKLEQQMDSFGWSIDIAKSENYIFGGPAMLSGRAMIVDSADLTSAQGIVGKEYGINFNFGYSVAYGYFFNTKESYAIGSPYGKIGSGTVTIFKYKQSEYVPKQVLNEKNIGSMFGAVLSSARLVGDTDTLFVGAPALWQGYGYNTGAVYVYQKIKQGSVLSKTLMLLRVIEGLNIGGQFGSAIANIGDMNGDNINDIAIAAPYENNGIGAVYMYCGASIADTKITTLTHLQKFEPSEFKNFGLSLTVLSDYDDNGCNELAIGAPGNGKVVLYNCITEIPITLKAVFPDLKKRDANTRFTFKSCFTVTYPPKLKHVIGSVQIKVEIKHVQAKLANPTKDAQYIEPLHITTTTYCRDVEVSTPPGNYNQLISYQITAKLVDNPEVLPYDKHRIMLSDRSQLLTKGTVRAADCTNENGCFPKLNMTINPLGSLTGVQKYTIGSSKLEYFTISVSNDGDTAYEMCLKGRLEGPEIYQAPSECSYEDNQFTCNPQQALPQYKHWPLEKFSMKMDKLTNKNMNITIYVELFDDCDNHTQHQDHSLTIHLASSTDFVLTGNTDIDNTVNITKSEINLWGKTISHVYWIYNKGPTTWEGLRYILTFKKELYIDQSVESTYVAFAAKSGIECSVLTANKEEAKVKCNIDKPLGTSRRPITVPIHILPGKLESLLNGVNETVITHCSLEFDNDFIHASITTTLTQRIAKVPVWIILAACFVGFLIVLLLILILVECGCMRRKNKQMLQNLKKDVRRQTIRRSMMQSEDRRKLIQEANNEPSCSIEHPEDPTKEVRFHQNTAKESDMQENIKNEKGQKRNPMLKELNERLNQQK